MGIRRTLAAGSALALAALVGGAGGGAQAAAVSTQLRVDQLGYLPGEAKHAYLMATGPVSHARFTVVDSHGRRVLTGTAGPVEGGWNAAYPDVYPISLDALRRPGRYRLSVGGTTSPEFTVGSRSTMYGRLVADGVTFFQTQRDGRQVIPGATHRKPSHLHDAKAYVYQAPAFEPDSDTITGAGLTRSGGPVDAEGGWFDAGDYLKFTHTTAYGDALLYASQRALGGRAPRTLAAEARHGGDWLAKMWDQHTRTLYLQVGIGSGNSAGTFTGDHDLWRLPEQDDSDKTPANRYAAAYRPVFAANKPGGSISPNLAGRVAAAFALGAQVDDPGRAAADYRAATSLYALAATKSPPSPLITALPNDYYPESTWHDDMEFGATEIAMAARRLHHDPAPYVKDATTWARAYLKSDTGDTFNLYDTSALAHADLLRSTSDLGLRKALIADLRRQLQTGATRAAADPFHAGGVYTDFDVDAHTFGLLATEALYRQATGDRRFQEFATEQRDWLFGANPWGTGFMVGEGAVYPRCMQHQVANLSGGQVTGAVVNGPNSVDQFEGGLGDYPDGMVKCPADGSDPYSGFTGKGSRYVDDVRSWQAVEPALDMTGTAIAGAAFQEAVR